jgi:hypothetical protein
VQNKEKLESKKLETALLKVALGFSVEEVTEEFADVDGQLKLLKRKRTKKQVPPDLKAVQMLLEENGENLSSLSDEELESEKNRLLSLLQEKESSGQVFDEIAVTPKKPRKPRAKPRKRVKRKEE